MNDDNHAKNRETDDNPLTRRTSAILKSLSQLGTLYSSENIRIANEVAKLSYIPEKDFQKSMLGNFFRNEMTLKSVTQNTSYQALLSIQKQSDFFRRLTTISEMPFFKIMERYRTVTDLYQSPAMGNIFAPSALAIAEEQMKKNADILKSMSVGAGILPSVISNHIANHELLSRASINYFKFDWEELVQKTIVGNSLREQSIVLAALNNFFEDEPDSFTNLAENIISSLECEPESDFSEIKMQIKSANVFSDLPTKVKKYFLLLFIYIILPTFFAVRDEILMNLIKQQCLTSFLCETKKEQVKNLEEGRSDELTYRDLNRIRVVRRDNVRLRTGPSMQANVIEVLPVNQPLLIMNRDNRTWLLVRTVLNGEEIEGWINRSYTTVLVK
ncbi:SH3 domain-containing protein [Pantoea dispersa]|uniref:SH3 domain-containing protein n=1 Tax=Pantoea dispersa TaxID=59814 RepID=UPI00321509F5